MLPRQETIPNVKSSPRPSQGGAEPPELRRNHLQVQGCQSGGTKSSPCPCQDAGLSYSTAPAQRPPLHQGLLHQATLDYLGPPYAGCDKGFSSSSCSRFWGLCGGCGIRPADCQCSQKLPGDHISQARTPVSSLPRDKAAFAMLPFILETNHKEPPSLGLASLELPSTGLSSLELPHYLHAQGHP